LAQRVRAGEMPDPRHEQHEAHEAHQEEAMAMVNPEEDGFGDVPELTRLYCRAGRKVFACVGFERGETGRGKPMVAVGVHCLRDLVEPDPELDPPSDEGLGSRMRLYMTDGGRKYGLHPLVKALGWKKPFDDEKDDQLGEVLVSGLFIGTVEIDRVPAKNRDGSPKVDADGKPVINEYGEVNTRSLEPYTGEFLPEWREQLREAADAYVERQEERERRRAGQRSRGGYGGGGGRRDKDIPF
jgi:hypothetical protein